MRSKFAVTSALVAALSVPASPALATDGFSLQFSGPSSAVVGTPLVLSAVGKNPGWADYPYATYLDADVFLPSAVPTCPATSSSAGQLAPSTGGSMVAYDVQVNSDTAGDFSIPVGFTPAVSGPLLVCGYTAGLAGETLTTASLTVIVGNAAPPTQAPSRPASLTAPRLTRSGNRLLCSPGRWSNTPTRFSYRWLVGGKPKRAASGPTLAVTRSLRGRTVRCGVTATNAAGSGTAPSNPLAIH